MPGWAVPWPSSPIGGSGFGRRSEQAFKEELEIGLLLPRNVIVYESEGGSAIETLDPERALEVAGNERLRPIAVEAKACLRAAIESLPAGP